MGDSRHQTQSLRFRRLRFTAHTGAIEQLVRHSVISKNKPHAHHETHLHAMISRDDSYPQFPGCPLGTPGSMAYYLHRTHPKKGKKNSLLQQTRLIIDSK